MSLWSHETMPLFMACSPVDNTNIYKAKVRSQTELSYKAGGVHLLLADQGCDIVSIVGETLHTTHKVVSAS